MDAVFGALRRERVTVHPVDTRVSVRAAQLLGKIRGGSELAIDAFVVAAADLAGGAIAATSDPDDLARLAARPIHARIFPRQLTRACDDDPGKFGMQKKCEDDNIGRQPPGRGSRRALSISRSD